MMLARETARREPIVARPGLRGAARYYDAVVDDARLTLATAQSAHLAGAVVANHTRVVALIMARGQVVGAVVRDEITGREVEVQARIVVNACGPWVDSVRSMDQTTNPHPLPSCAHQRRAPDYPARAVDQPARHRV